MAHRYETETRGHVWKRHEDGDIDIFAFEAGDRHNGPQCINCGYGFCHHCDEVPDEDCSKPALETEFHEVGSQKLLESAGNGS